MKKLIFLTTILMLSLQGISCFAQPSYYSATAIVYNHAVTQGTPTLTNTDTATILYGDQNGKKPITQNSDIVFTWTATQLTGTLSGQVIFQGSMTGTQPRVGQGDWQTLVNDKTQSLITDTVTVSGTTSGVFIIPNVKYKYVRGRLISGGTATSTFGGTFFNKPK